MFDRSDFGDWFGGMFRGFGPRGPRWRNRTRFERGDIRYVILSLLKERPMHGYEVIRELERRFGGAYAPSPGTVYPTLQMLEEMDYVTAAEQDGKRVYTITEAGLAYLRENQERVDGIWGRMREDEPGSGEMHDLRQEFMMLVTMLPLMMKRLTPEQAARAGEVLARARREVEDIARSR